RLDPLHSHREYAAQLETLVSLLGLPVAARSAYLENELRLFRALDSLLLESLPLRLRGELANRFVAGEGGLMRWWHSQLLARAGVAGDGVEGLGEEDWPDMPPACFALGWVAGLRQAGERDPGSGAPGDQGCPQGRRVALRGAQRVLRVRGARRGLEAHPRGAALLLRRGAVQVDAAHLIVTAAAQEARQQRERGQKPDIAHLPIPVLGQQALLI